MIDWSSFKSLNLYAFNHQVVTLNSNSKDYGYMEPSKRQRYRLINGANSSGSSAITSSFPMQINSFTVELFDIVSSSIKCQLA